MTDQDYEARATRLVELWFDNDEGTFGAIRDVARGARLENPEYPVVASADAIKEWFQSTFIPGEWDESESLTGPAADLLLFAVGLVDWVAIAKGYQEEDVEAGIDVVDDEDDA